MMTGQPDLAAQAFEKAQQLLSKELQSRQEKARKVIDVPVRKQEPERIP